ncbi:MAG TPA: hypothetical protein PKU77_00915 [Ferruginibacter sp.]|nr:hypothetical protein [Ferruginibacter sp.]
MKTIFLLFILMLSLNSNAQQKKDLAFKSLSELIQQKNQPGKKEYQFTYHNYTKLKADYSIKILPLDNMPCLVPNIPSFNMPCFKPNVSGFSMPVLK